MGNGSPEVCNKGEQDMRWWLRQTYRWGKRQPVGTLVRMSLGLQSAGLSASHVAGTPHVKDSTHPQPFESTFASHFRQARGASFLPSIPTHTLTLSQCVSEVTSGDKEVLSVA